MSLSRCEECLGEIVGRIDHLRPQDTLVHGQSDDTDSPPDYPELRPVEPRGLKKSLDSVPDSNTAESGLVGIESNYQTDGKPYEILV